METNASNSEHENVVAGADTIPAMYTLTQGSDECVNGEEGVPPLSTEESLTTGSVIPPDYYDEGTVLPQARGASSIYGDKEEWEEINASRCSGVDGPDEFGADRGIVDEFEVVVPPSDAAEDDPAMEIPDEEEEEEEGDDHHEDDEEEEEPLGAAEEEDTSAPLEETVGEDEGSLTKDYDRHPLNDDEAEEEEEALVLQDEEDNQLTSSSQPHPFNPQHEEDEIPSSVSSSSGSLEQMTTAAQEVQVSATGGEAAGEGVSEVLHQQFSDESGTTTNQNPLSASAGDEPQHAYSSKSIPGNPTTTNLRRRPSMASPIPSSTRHSNIDAYRITDEEFESLQNFDWSRIKPEILGDLEFIIQLPEEPALDYEALGPSLPEPDPDAPAKTLFLDLDETLAHTSLDFSGPPFRAPDLIFESETDGAIAHVYFRPWLDEFLHILAQYYELVVYTASLKPYADLILDELDSTHRISYRLYREHCTQYGKSDIFFKDLHGTGRRLEDSIVVDNRLISFGLNIENSIFVSSYVGDEYDTELLQLIPLLVALSKQSDVRPSLNQTYKLKLIMQKFKEWVEGGSPRPSLPGPHSSKSRKRKKTQKNKSLPSAPVGSRKQQMIPPPDHASNHSAKTNGSGGSPNSTHGFVERLLQVEGCDTNEHSGLIQAVQTLGEADAHLSASKYSVHAQAVALLGTDKSGSGGTSSTSPARYKHRQKRREDEVSTSSHDLASSSSSAMTSSDVSTQKEYERSQMIDAFPVVKAREANPPADGAGIVMVSDLLGNVQPWSDVPSPTCNEDAAYVTGVLNSSTPQKSSTGGTTNGGFGAIDNPFDEEDEYCDFGYWSDDLPGGSSGQLSIVTVVRVDGEPATSGSCSSPKMNEYGKHIERPQQDHHSPPESADTNSKASPVRIKRSRITRLAKGTNQAPKHSSTMDELTSVSGFQVENSSSSEMGNFERSSERTCSGSRHMVALQKLAEGQQRPSNAGVRDTDAGLMTKSESDPNITKGTTTTTSNYHMSHSNSLVHSSSRMKRSGSRHGVREDSLVFSKQTASSLDLGGSTGDNKNVANHHLPNSQGSSHKILQGSAAELTTSGNGLDPNRRLLPKNETVFRPVFEGRHHHQQQQPHPAPSTDYVQRLLKYKSLLQSASGSSSDGGGVDNNTIDDASISTFSRGIPRLDLSFRNENVASPYSSQQQAQGDHAVRRTPSDPQNVSPECVPTSVRSYTKTGSLNETGIMFGDNYITVPYSARLPTSSGGFVTFPMDHHSVYHHQFIDRRGSGLASASVQRSGSPFKMHSTGSSSGSTTTYVSSPSPVYESRMMGRTPPSSSGGFMCHSAFSPTQATDSSSWMTSNSSSPPPFNMRLTEPKVQQQQQSTFQQQTHYYKKSPSFSVTSTGATNSVCEDRITSSSGGFSLNNNFHNNNVFYSSSFIHSPSQKRQNNQQLTSVPQQPFVFRTNNGPSTRPYSPSTSRCGSPRISLSPQQQQLPKSLNINEYSPRTLPLILPSMCRSATPPPYGMQQNTTSHYIGGTPTTAGGSTTTSSGDPYFRGPFDLTYPTAGGGIMSPSSSSPVRLYPASFDMTNVVSPAYPGNTTKGGMQYGSNVTSASTSSVYPHISPFHLKISRAKEANSFWNENQPNQHFLNVNSIQQRFPQASN